MSFAWIIFSYLAGSVPSGYLIARFFGKNILALGWKKTSGSNVFKNVGKWQGILTGLLDVAKGYLAVWGAQKLGLPPVVQVYSGVAAVIGHNWSIFLNFSGGRGIATFGGALLAFSPQTFLISLIPLVITGLIWNMAIGTILMLATAIFLPLYSGRLKEAAFFTLICLLPIFLKRLSPVRDIFPILQKLSLIRNRLIFDNDEFLRKFRIAKYLDKENKSRTAKTLKIIVLPIVVPSRLVWLGAKFGFKIVKKPIQILFGNGEKVVIEITVDDFKKMMIASSKKIVVHQEEINRINVFPVADKDTGYNMAATLLGVEGVISQKDYPSFRELTEDIKEAAMINARGNAGMILTAYIIEVLDRIKHLQTIDAFHLALALDRGIKASNSAIAEPVEGTILDVISAAGEKCFEMAKVGKEKNIIKILSEAQKAGEIALQKTKEKLAVLKENDVVDAGALGFVKILEAWLESLKGITIESKFEISSPIVQPLAQEELKYKYEIIATFERPEDLDRSVFEKELLVFGDSLDILELDDKIKLHIHTDRPDEVREKLEGFKGLEISLTNMQGKTEKAEKKPLGLVTDDIADLPREFLEKHQVEEATFTTRFPDGEIIRSKEEIYPRMKEALKAGKPLPTTSAPTFAEYLALYQKALEKFEKILVITVSSKISGAYSSARIARSIFKKPDKLNIYVFDCGNGEAGEGLVVMRAQELIDRGMSREEIVEDLKNFCPKVTLLGCLPDFKYVVKGGRVRLPKLLVFPIYLLQKLGLNVMIKLKNDKVGFSGLRIGKSISKIMLREIEKQSDGRKIRVAITHADNSAEAQKLKEGLKKSSRAEVVFISPVSPVVATHVGPGAILVGFHPIDETS